MYIGSTKWDIRRYSDRIGLSNNGLGDTEAEKVLTKRFPPIHDPPKLEITPGISTDRAGNILVWYLPGILTSDRSVGQYCQYRESTTATELSG